MNKLFPVMYIYNGYLLRLDKGWDAKFGSLETIKARYGKAKSSGISVSSHFLI